MIALSVRNLSKEFGAFTAVNGISFDVSEHRIVGFLGPNGAGKTTTLRMLVGLSKPTSGTISILGKELIFGSTDTLQSVGYLPEQPALYSWMTGAEYLSFIADIFGLKALAKKAKIAELLALVALTDAKKKRIGSYSNGMKQRLGIAQALMNDPKLVIFDEPVSALDPVGRKEVLKNIVNLKQKATVLFSTHILSDVDRICDDVILLNHGKIIVSSPLADLKQKYSSQILDVELTKNAETIKEDLEKEPWVSKIEISGNHIKAWVSDETAMTKNLPLKFFAKHDIGITKYGLELPETEDLFTELLNEKNE